MSADRISVCPQCRKRAVERSEAIEREMQVGYGKIPARDYEDLGFTLAIINRAMREATLLENWEVRVDEGGQFSVDYFCRCEVCKWEWCTKHEHQIDLEKEGIK